LPCKLCGINDEDINVNFHNLSLVAYLALYLFI